jgi:protein-S-isoprenylcysteine O-methyltransferase Ste14
MAWTRWLWRSLLALLMLCDAAAIAFNAASAVHGAKVAIPPIVVSAELWDLWLLSWLAAALWSRPATSRPRIIEEIAHWTPTLAGVFILSYGSAFQYSGPLRWLNTAKPVSLTDGASWIATGLGAAGLGFTWWARVSLGSLWSGSVSLKQDHAVVRSGPYNLVRHPIYTGLILAAMALALQIGMAANLFGACLFAFGLWLKAALEERFLAEELGPAAYADYRRSTPMLVPFWPA